MGEQHRSSEPCPPQYDYIFGFGSIINTATHAPWLADANSGTHAALPGQRARILRNFGYRRGWNFRSNTGFTALGITRGDERGQATNINGVLFRIDHDVLVGFDRREVGYDRVEISMQYLEMLPPLSDREDVSNENCNTGECVLDIQPNERIWLYVPQAAYCAVANEDHPILQSYVDTVMQGCIEWGGEEMATEFVENTSDWSPYFLNDTPSSRRPWLFRKEYNTVDRILSQNSNTHFADRRHPEEFASAFLIKMMRGTWSVPRRNTVFTGRDAEIGQIHARLTTQRIDHSGVAKLEVAGMGGVGKTQLCTEYCYRYFPSYYGLVIWLRAPSAESIVAGYRQLMADTTGVDVKDKDTDEVVAEVKARLFRSKVPWLLVFDNLEDSALLEKFVPNGGTGHVVVTTRLLNTDSTDFGEHSTMMLGCFNPSESVELLRRAAGTQNISGDTHIDAASKLAVHLGHLPLALGVAAAYMRRCDVDCSEYLARYMESETSGAHLGHEAVSSSLSLSLEAIKAENPVAWEVLRLTSFLGPDQITKKLLRSLLMAKNNHTKEDASASAKADALASDSARFDSLTQLSMVGGITLLCLAIGRRALGSPRINWSSLGVGALTVLSTFSVTALFSIRPKTVVTSSSSTESSDERPIPRTASFSSNVFEQTDQTWKILKSFSLLVVKEGKGSIHRLLAQALRMSQSEGESRDNLDICLQALLHLWTFKPDQVDTWEESTIVLEHIKAIVMQSVELKAWKLETAILSKEAGVFSAMALNRFEEAQLSLEQSLRILDGVEDTGTSHIRARASALHELGRVFRYEGKFQSSEEALGKALELRNSLATEALDARHGLGATLHELGVLEVKKHELDSATDFLQQALELRRSLELESKGIEADCASTLHQLAAVEVARKPPSLDRAESLLKEALGLNMQIGQRAATLKQLARVAIRRGEFDIAERSLAQAAELYVELYGKNTLHINVAGVQFQQGALAFQREQFEQARLHFTECLRARRHVYAYSQGNHLEVSTVLHELGCVAFAQRNISRAFDSLMAEKGILDELYESSSQHQRLFQARLTNLTWLRKCAKERGDDKDVRRIVAERNDLKRRERQRSLKMSNNTNVCDGSLGQELLRCRSCARKSVLATPKWEESSKKDLVLALANLSRQIERSPESSLREAAVRFQKVVSDCLSNPNQCTVLLEACDDLRDVLRSHGLQVNDGQSRKQKTIVHKGM